MLLRYRPLVLVSSSIVGLELPRREIREAVESLGIAESWLFEFDAVAAGSSPSAQYLQRARDCDLFVLVVGHEVRPGTRDEYDEGFRDNPHKILPFLLDGDEGTTSELRATLRSRHTYREATLEDLPSAVARSVEAVVHSGEIARPALRERLLDQRARLRSIAALPGEHAFPQRFQLDGRTVDATQLFGEISHAVIDGEAGSGKSDAAITGLLAATDELLPIYVQARAGATLAGLVETVFDSVRYTPGPDGIRQFLRDGCLRLVVDGTDELNSTDQVLILGDVAAEVEAHPRTQVALIRRSASHPAFTAWERATILPLDKVDVDRLFDLVGYPGERRADVFSNLGRLVRLPFWAPAIAKFGLSAVSGPELLAAVIGARFELELPGDPIGQMRLADALAFVAFRCRPEVETGIAAALDALAAWGREERTRELFDATSAETVLGNLQATGLVASDAGRLRFIHPLVAAYLAARRAISAEDLALLPDDEDLQAFVAAILPEERSGDWVNVLARTSPVVLFRALNLAGLRPRHGDMTTDLIRFEESYRRLAVLGGPAVVAAAHDTTTSLLEIGQTVCIQRVAGDGPLHEVGRPLNTWATENNRMTCWPRNPFLKRWPEVLAGEQVVNAFKQAWKRLDPGGRAYAPFDAEATAVIHPLHTLEARVLAHVKAVRAARVELLASSGLERWLDRWEGQPAITIHLSARTPTYHVSWRQLEATVEQREDEDARYGTQLLELLADPAAVAYRDLTREIDRMLGDTLGSGSLRRASPVDWAL